jgi:hypothetical protein
MDLQRPVELSTMSKSYTETLYFCNQRELSDSYIEQLYERISHVARTGVVYSSLPWETHGR